MTIMQKLFGRGKQAAAPVVDKAVLLEKIRQSDLFKDLPVKDVEEMLAHMETVHMKAGDAVVREGDEGDFYYLLVSGNAKVTRRQQAVAELAGPTGFGEEALISNAKRNATVTMSGDGVLMRLSKDGFNDYVKDHLVTWVSPVESQAKIGQGAKWIDVRDPSETKQSRLPGAISIPMEDLRKRTSDLNQKTFYICYCENGRLSSTAAFLLRQRGFNVGVLRGGLQSLKRAGVA